MKTYDERTKDILSKAAARRRRRRAITSAVSLCCCMVLIVGALLIPRGAVAPTDTPEIVATVENYDPLKKALSKLLENDTGVPKGEDLVDSVPLPESAPSMGSPNNSPVDDTGSYEEVTDNQVEGVTEADLIKRSDKHIFYLRDYQLTVYSIEGLDSKVLGSYEIGSELDPDYRVYTDGSEMYLSQDCRTVTIIAECYYKPGSQRYLYILSLDVTDPERITVSGSCFLTGSYNTSRLADDRLYIISSLYVESDADLEDESTFLPGYGTPDDLTYLEPGALCIPNEPTAAMYTVVTVLDGDSLAVVDSEALLSYTGPVYMSQENIYVTHSRYDPDDNSSYAVTEISRIAYSDQGLQNEGAFQVDGSVEDQYCLDEYNGILRVVTTIDHKIGRLQTLSGTDYTYFVTESRTINASLYCIDLTDHSIRAKVERFAPDGESVRSVRFDGDQAYVCTSIVLQDPVFFFDLSDLDDIRYKDTGTISGYSMSLVDFADGFLMGIGYGGNFDILKIEMYREGAATVESHCVYEQADCRFSEEYKSYYIDRENRLIGLGIRSYSNSAEQYILLHFDGYELVTLLDVPVSGDLRTMRSVYIDGYLYIFADDFHVEPVG